VFVQDQYGRDLLGSIDFGTTAYAGLNIIQASGAQGCMPDMYNYGQTVHATYFPLITGDLTLIVSGQATVSANWLIVLTFIK
jgi:hypothetical protein